MLDICPGGARASCSQGGVSSATKPPKKRVAGSPCLPDMLLALPCRSLEPEKPGERAQQNQEAKLFSCSVSPAPSTEKV